uniref:Fork-head domain-containing protein n=1 Tax=Parastrongyloides trichosuri TaxID=131310 RepID=A0A0N5A563_PARTI
MSNYSSNSDNIQFSKLHKTPSYYNMISPDPEHEFNDSIKNTICQRNVLTPDSAISIEDSFVTSKNDFSLSLQSNNTSPTSNCSKNGQQYGSPHISKNCEALDAKKYIQSMIATKEMYSVQNDSTSALSSLESFTKTALSNVIALPDPTINVSGHYYKMKSSGYSKPSCSYPCLIAIALNNAATHKLNVAELYEFIQHYFPYFQKAPEGWKNSVRHNLSTNSWFRKINEGRSGYVGRRSFLWGFTNDTIKTKCLQDVRKQVNKKYEDMCTSVVCTSLLEPLLKGERSFYPNSCHKSPFFGTDVLSNKTSTESVFPDKFYSQPTTSSTLSENVSSKKRKRSSKLMHSASSDEILQTSDSTYEIKIKRPFQISSSSFNDTSRLKQNTQSYMLPYNFPLPNESPSTYSCNYSSYQQMSFGDSNNFARSPIIPHSQNSMDFYNNTYHMGSNTINNFPVYDHEKNTYTFTNTSTENISQNPLDLLNFSWSPMNLNPSQQSNSLDFNYTSDNFGASNDTQAKEEVNNDEILNEFFVAYNSPSL